MKSLLVLACVSLLSYAIYLPIKQNLALHWAGNALVQDNPEVARAYIEQASREWPQFYAKRVSALCGDITLVQARRMIAGPEPDFGSAAGLLRDLPTQCSASGRDGEATRLLDYVAMRHIQRATTRCRQQDYTGAFADFQQLATLPYPERSLASVQTEAAWCRMALAKALAQQQMFEAAMAQLHRVITMGNGSMREAALKEMQSVVLEEFRYWLERRQYSQAFKQLGDHQQKLGDEPALAHFFAEVASRMERQVFGAILAQQCRETLQPHRVPDNHAKPSSLRRSVGPVTVASAAVGSGLTEDAPGANLVIHNTTKHLLKILLRGPEHHDVVLAPQAKTALTVEPAAYLVGVYTPGNCHVQSDRTAWTIKPWAPYSVRFYEAN